MTQLGVYGEKLVSDYLRARDELEDLDCRVVGKTPEDQSTPWVRVIQINAGQTGMFDHLVPFTFQFDCYAGEDGGQPQANLLRRTVRAVLPEMVGSHQEGVVTGTEVVGDLRLPDTDLKPARERFVLTVNVWAHP